jgi:hypothetical protein
VTCITLGRHNPFGHFYKLFEALTNTRKLRQVAFTSP